MTIRRRTFLDTAGKLALTGIAGGPLALAVGQIGQVSAAAPLTVGDMTVIPLLDGVVEVDEGIFAGTDDEARRALLAAAGQPAGKIRLDVNAFLIKRQGSTVLIDAGTRDLYGPTLGKVPQALAHLGIALDSIDHVVLTHMHNDHVGGLVDSSGTAVFSKAQLHVSVAEWHYWTSEENFARASEHHKFSFAGARAAAPAYRARLRTFEGSSEFLPCISPIALPGHSPAHTGFRIAEGNQQIVIWGDTVVSPELQFDYPDWSSAFDADRDASVSSRKRILDEVATDHVRVLGMHLPFPGHGYVERYGNSYRFTVTS